MVARKDQADTIAFRPKPENVQNMLGSIRAKFLDRYPRVERTSHFVEMSKEEATYYPPMPGYHLFKLMSWSWKIGQGVKVYSTG